MNASELRFNPSSDKWLTVILGAGASYDCGTTAEVDQLWRPPVAKELFSNRSPSFNSILHQYPGAERLSDQIRSAVSRDESFEAVLRTIRDSKNLGTRRAYRNVPLYIQHLIGDVSANYITTGATAFDTLVRQLDESDYTRILFLTVNYDLFLERAITGHYGVQFNSLDSYVSGIDKWLLVKAHGSVSWNQRVTNVPPHDVRRATPDYVVRVLDGMRGQELEVAPEIVIHNGKLDDARFKPIGGGQSAFHYPALAVPIEGKTEFVCPQEHIDLAKSFLNQCSDFLVLGFSGLDTHVVSLLKDVVNMRKLLVVNKDGPDAGLTIQRLGAVNSIFRTKEVMPPIVANYGDSFSEFMRNDYLTRVFLRETVGA